MDWFRFYSEVVRDPKVQKLSPTMFKHWINVLCLSNDNEPRGQVPMPCDVAYHLRISEGRAVVLLDELLALTLLDADDDGNLSPHNWSTRQYKSDTSTERVKKHRRNVSETPPEAETEQSRKQSRTEAEDRPVHVDDPVDQIAADFAAFGKVTAGTPRAIEESVEDYGVEWVQQAVRRTAGAGFDGQPPWSYVEEPLRRWKKQGYPDEVQVDERKAMGRNGIAVAQAGDSAAELARFNGGFGPVYVPDDGATDQGASSLAAADDPSRLEVRR